MNEDVLLDDDELAAEDDENDDESVAEDDEFLPLPFPGLPGFPSPFGGGRRSVRSAPNRSYAPPGMTLWVARPEFNQALSKIRADIAKNSTGIRQVNTRVAAEAAVNARQNQAIVKQNKALTAQAKALAGVRKEVKKAKDNALLMALLSRPKTLDPVKEDTTILLGTGETIEIPKGTRIAYEPDKNNSMFLLLALMGGFDDGMALPLLLLAGGL